MSIPTLVSLAHRVHEIVTMSENPKHVYVGCECGYGPITFLGHAAHVAEVAEGLAKAEPMAAVERVRALHVSFSAGYPDWCGGCGVRLPCPTLFALDGPNEDRQ